MNVLSLFSGIGGIDLGLERAGMRVVAQCEIDPFCRAVLAKHWPDVPRFDDVRELHADALPRIDIVAGGFPCQDVSSAGKGAGIGGARSGLWREMARLIAECRPAWVLVENVPALRTRGADRVLADLEALGYDAWPLVVGAWAVGAPHRRDRVWIVAHAEDRVLATESGGSRSRERESKKTARRRALWERVRRSDDGRPSDPGAELAHADGGRLEGERLADREPGDEGASGGVPDGCDGACVADASEAGRRQSGSGSESSRSTGTSRRLQPGRFRGRVADAPRVGGIPRPVTWRRRRSESLAGRWPARPGERQHEWEAPRLVEFPVGSAASGIPVRLVRAANRNALRAYGNAVVPQVVEAIGRAILKGNA